MASRGDVWEKSVLGKGKGRWPLKIPSSFLSAFLSLFIYLFQKIILEIWQVPGTVLSLEGKKRAPCFPDAQSIGRDG